MPATAYMNEGSPKRTVKELILLAMNGNEKAFADLVRMYQPRLYRMVYAVIRSAEEAQDILQETWLRVYSALPNFRGDSSFYTYVYRIALNQAFKTISRSKRKEQIMRLFHFTPLSETPETVVLTGEVGDILDRSVSKLPLKQKKIFVLRNADKRSFKEISEILDISEGNARVLYHYSLKTLKKFLIKEGIEP